MRLIQGKFCIDRYESSTQVKTKRGWRYHSPFESVKGLDVRAVSRRGRYPQAYISRNEAEAACKRSHKRLCTGKEWVTACKGKHPTTYPYGDEYKPGRCNDHGISPLNHFFGKRDGPPMEAYGWGPMNDPRLNRLKGTLARTGRFRRCRNSWGLYDMVGNLHEWTAEPGGTFRGGYYLDTKINGEGCNYKTVAHNADYHDYSTGFRCCADPR
jgi:formylglycine-generating enzyme required for sulfatase activity